MSNTRSGCVCTNHLGTQKQQHRTRGDAVKWIIRRGLAHGMRMEPYPCPTSSRWHVRTARKA